MDEDDRVRAVAELLNKVRNNVFHGVNVYDDKEDLKLLMLVNPVLLAVLLESERGPSNPYEAPGGQGKKTPLTKKSSPPGRHRLRGSFRSDLVSRVQVRGALPQTPIEVL